MPPGGEVDLSPYNEKTHEYEMDKYILDPVIAASEDHANYADFAYIVAACNAVPRLVVAVREARRELQERWAEASAYCSRLSEMEAVQAKLAAAEQTVGTMQKALEKAAGELAAAEASIANLQDRLCTLVEEDSRRLAAAEQRAKEAEEQLAALGK